MALLNEGVRLIIVLTGILISLSALVAAFTHRIKLTEKEQKKLKQIQRMAKEEAMRQSSSMFQRKAELDLIALLDVRSKSKGK